jgi:hypothetical protein
MDQELEIFILDTHYLDSLGTYPVRIPSSEGMSVFPGDFCLYFPLRRIRRAGVVIFRIDPLLEYSIGAQKV